MKMRWWVFASSFMISLSAIAQSESSGTVVILTSSENEIVVAADSRTHSGVSYVDSRCKITALGNKLIFAASGHTGFGPLSGPFIWDTHAIARQEFLRLTHKHTPQGLTLLLAKSWGKLAKKKLKADLVRDREGTISGVTGNTLSSALFASFEDDGIWIVTVRLTYFYKGSSPHTNFMIDKVLREPKSVQMGETDIANELLVGKTERALHWRQRVGAEIVNDDLVFTATRLVQATIEYQSGKIIRGQPVQVVGGRVDVVELKRNVGIRWHARKCNCPEN